MLCVSPAALLKLKQATNSSMAEVQVRVQGQEEHGCPLCNSIDFLLTHNECEEFRSMKQKLGLATHRNLKATGLRFMFPEAMRHEKPQKPTQTIPTGSGLFPC